MFNITYPEFQPKFYPSHQADKDQQWEKDRLPLILKSSQKALVVRLRHFNEGIKQKKWNETKEKERKEKSFNWFLVQYKGAIIENWVLVGGRPKKMRQNTKGWSAWTRRSNTVESRPRETGKKRESSLLLFYYYFYFNWIFMYFLLLLKTKTKK